VDPFQTDKRNDQEFIERDYEREMDDIRPVERFPPY